MQSDNNMLTYFRQDHCIYLTKTMFQYMKTMALSLSGQKDTGSVNIYMLASLSSLLRILQINLRCLAICKINLEDIISEEEYLSFQETRSAFDDNFGPALKAAISARAAAEKAEAEARTKAKEEAEKEGEAKQAAESAEKEEGKAEEAKAPETEEK